MAAPDTSERIPDFHPMDKNAGRARTGTDFSKWNAQNGGSLREIAA
jgi:hypothetical protein